MSLVIPPLQTIQAQMAEVCRNWGIPFINLSEIKDPEKIGHEIKKIKPKVILASIEDITQEEIQTELQLLDISYVTVDECQVSMFYQCHHC